MRKIILFSILAICVGFFVFLSQRGGEIFKKETPISNLGGFLKLTREDPLFYSPFFDPTEFKKAIKNLRESESQLKKVIIENLEQTTGFEKDYYIPILKENDLFSYQFLENLILVNQETKEFLKNPSIEWAGALLTLYDNAADSYIQDISSKIKVLEEIEKYKGAEEHYFFFVDSVTSFKVVKNDFLTIKENGYELKEEIAKRRNCLLGKEDCEILLKTKDNSSFIDLMEGGEFNFGGEKIDFIWDNLPYPSKNEIKKVKGPYKIKSFCWQNPGFEQWMYLVYIEQDGKALVAPKLANQNYYRKVPPGAEDAINKALWEKGLKFYIQSEATTYECTDLTFYPQLLTLDFLKEQIKLGQVTKEELEKKLDYKLLIENQFGLMTPAINTVSDHLEILRLYQIINKVTIAPEALFTLRSAYSLFYFPFAKSIWRIDKSLQYFVPEKEKPLTERSEFVTLDELEKLGYTKEEIKKFHIDTEEFLKALLENQP